MPRTLRVELSLQGTSKSSLEEADFSNSWIVRTFYQTQGNVCNSSHQIETIKESSSDTNKIKVWRFITLTILDIFFPLSCSWVSEVSVENLNWCFHLDFKLSRNFRTSNLHLKDFSLMHDVLLIVGFNILPKNEAIPCKWYKGG